MRTSLRSFLAVTAAVLSIGLQANAWVGKCPIEPVRVLPAEKQLPQQDPCTGRSDSLLALAGIQVLFICEGGKAIRHFDYSTGSGGVGKTREGDCKTPLGTYPLGEPRTSIFGIFVPVGYPTAAQTRNGFTGGDVGIHGPTRENKDAGIANVEVNWTEGCIALQDDQSIFTVASWLSKHPAGRFVHIQAP